MKKVQSVIPVTDLLNALGDDVRLRICRIVEREELSVGEIATVVQLPQSTVSRHLKVLASAGLVTRRAAGTATLYRLLMDDLAEAARPLWMAVREQLAGSEDIQPRLSEDLRRLDAVLAQRRTDSVSFFGKVAGEWDDVRGELFGVGFTAPALLSLLDLSWVVADVGCGTGNVAEWLSPVVREVIAVDSSEPMLEAAKKRLSRFENVRFVEGDVTSLPLGDDSVDVAVLALVLHHLEDAGAAVGELGRIVKPGGRVLVIDMYAHEQVQYRNTMGHVHLGFSESEIVGWLGEASFERVEVRPIPGRPDAVGPGLFAASGVRSG